MKHKISIIIPTRNEAARISKTLTALLPFRHAGHEIILVDGDSEDNTRELAWSFCDTLLQSRPGRARQMNKGAEAATGQLLLFLHADTRLPQNAPALLQNMLAQHPAQDELWGRFDVRLSGRAFTLRMVERMINLRSRLTGIATGDQAIFVSSTLFKRVGGFANIPIMEDIALSKSLKRIRCPYCITEKLLTSSRRWEDNGIIKTILLMWGLRLAYFFGVPPKTLKHYYR